MILVIGSIVLIIVLAILLPIIEINQLVRRSTDATVTNGRCNEAR